MRSFITGSRRYGIPNESSDLDLVILVDEETKKTLNDFKDIFLDAGPKESKPIRFGILNLIVLTSEEEFCFWKMVTESLSKGEPVGSEEAKKTFRDLAGKIGGLELRGHSGEGS